MGDFDKEPIATVTYEWSKDYYSQFVNTANNRLIPNANKLYGLFNFFIAFLLIITWDTILVIWGLALCGITIYTLYSTSTNMIFKTCKRLHGLNQKIDFYNSYFTVTDKYCSETLPYELLYAIKSSKYGYALCDSKLSGHFIPKGECSPQLISFIEEIQDRLISQEKQKNRNTKRRDL